MVPNLMGKCGESPRVVQASEVEVPGLRSNHKGPRKCFWRGGGSGWNYALDVHGNGDVRGVILARGVDIADGKSVVVDQLEDPSFIMGEGEGLSAGDSVGGFKVKRRPQEGSIEGGVDPGEVEDSRGEEARVVIDDVVTGGGFVGVPILFTVFRSVATDGAQDAQ